jgi:lipopolysaccharide/colanic/teichoic acid biosynthesis glycosyltransferase
MRAVLTRVADLPISVALILFTLPLIGFVSLAIKLDSEGPVFAFYPRLASDGRRFFVVKFRTTEHDPDRAPWNRGTRETRVGALLSYSRIDELPVFFNVLLGDIRLLGSERTETRDLQNLAKWAAWVAAAAAAFQALG